MSDACWVEEVGEQESRVSDSAIGVPSVTYICVNYRSAESALQLLSDLQKQVGEFELRIYAVDNSMDRMEADKLSSATDSSYPVRVIVPPDNLGYFGGACEAYESDVSKFGSADWYVVSNVDIRIHDREFVSEITTTKFDSDVLSVCPAIISEPTGRNQNPHFVLRPSYTKLSWYRFLYSSAILGVLHELASNAKSFIRGQLGYPKARIDIQDEERFPIYAGHGSIFILSSRFFESGSTLLYPPFLFSEELHVAEQIRARSGRAVYMPKLRVSHDEHVSMRLIRGRQIRKYEMEALDYILTTYYQVPHC